MHRRGQPGGAGLLGPLSLTLLFALAVGAFALHFRTYYFASEAARRLSPLHPLLRPAGLVGLSTGAVAGALFLWNLTFLLRRTEIGQKMLPGSRRSWVNWHVFTGLSSAPLVLLHAGFTLRNTVAGHSLVALTLVVITGGFGRYFYARLPRTQAPAGRSRASARLLSSWRLVHRWLAILLVVLAAIHVAMSLRYASFDLTAAHGITRGAR